MALVIADRVKETTNTDGAVDLVLNGAADGFQSFLDGVGDTNTTYYCIVNANQWEVGVGTYTAVGNTLSRTTVYSSSNAGAKINIVGVATVFCTYVADKAVLKAVDGTIEGRNIVADGSKLDLIEPSATADQTDLEIETAYNNQVGVVSQVDAEAGVSTSVKRWTPERVSQAIEALGGGGPDVVSGPASSIDNYLALFDGTTGKLIKQGAWYIDGGGGLSTASGFLNTTATLDDATGNEVANTLSATVNKATSGDDTLLLLSKTDTASPGTSLLLDCQTGGVTQASIDDTGNVYAFGDVVTESSLVFKNSIGQTLRTISNSGSIPNFTSGSYEIGNAAANASSPNYTWKNAFGTGMYNTTAGGAGISFSISNTRTVSISPDLLEVVGSITATAQAIGDVPATLELADLDDHYLDINTPGGSGGDLIYFDRYSASYEWDRLSFRSGNIHCRQMAGDVGNAVMMGSVFPTFFAGNSAVGVTTGKPFGFSVESNLLSASSVNIDVALSRLGSGSMALGNGTQGDTSGDLQLGTITATAPAITDVPVTVNGTVGQTADLSQWIPNGATGGDDARITEIGDFSNTQGQTDSEAFGDGATVTNGRSVAFGTGSTGSGYQSVAVGQGATAAGTSSIAVGRASNVTGTYNMVFGEAGSITNGTGNLAFGRAVSITAAISNSIVFGDHRNLYGYDYTHVTPLDFTLNACGGSGTDIAGANLNIAPGRGTGTGVAGNIVFKKAPAGTTGTTLNALTDAFIVNGETGAFDNTLDDATGNEIAHTFSYTANKLTSGDDTGLLISKTDTASPGTSLLLDCQTDAASVFSVDDVGTVEATDGNFDGQLFINNAATAYQSAAEVRVHNSGGWAGWRCLGSSIIGFCGALEYWSGTQLGSNEDAMILGSFSSHNVVFSTNDTRRGGFHKTTGVFDTEYGISADADAITTVPFTATGAVGHTASLGVFNSGTNDVLTVSPTGLMTVGDGTDADVDLVQVNVTGDPKLLHWDESTDRFQFTKGAHFGGNVYLLRTDGQDWYGFEVASGDINVRVNNTDGVVLRNDGVVTTVAGVFAWSSTAQATGTVQSGISEISAGVLAVGNGTAADKSGELQLAKLTATASAITDVPVTINLAAGQTANAFDVTSNGGTAGDLFQVNASGYVGVVSGTPEWPLEVHSPSAASLQWAAEFNNVNDNSGAAVGVLFGCREAEKKGAIAFERTASFGRGKFVFLVNSGTSTPTEPSLSDSRMEVGYDGASISVPLTLSDTASVKSVHQTSEVTSLPTGTTQTITLDDNNHQTLDLTSTTGDTTVTLTVPSGSAAGTLILEQHATTARDITWALSSGTLKWCGTEPAWSSDSTSDVRIVRLYIRCPYRHVAMGWSNNVSFCYRRSRII
jgi:hypothetical protein